MIRHTLFRAYILLIVLPITVLAVVVNARLYTSAYDPQRSDVPAQLRFIRAALDGGAGEDMQQFFPEGYFFSHVLYGLAWVNVGLGDTAQHELAVSEASWALEQLESPAGRSVFSEALTPPYGVFYVGWSNWLRGGLLKLQTAAERDAAEVERFQADMRALAAAFEASETPFLAAYPGQAWPVDSTVGVAALRLHDRLFESVALTPPLRSPLLQGEGGQTQQTTNTTQFEAIIAEWVQKAKLLVDPATGLLPHRVDYQLGAMLDGARGSSQSVMQRFLPEIDPAWAAEQYAGFRERFVTTVLGVPGVREYPHGTEGAGDVDSGPLLFSVSLSASVVTVAAARVQADAALAHPLLDVGEALGMAVEFGGQKRYAMGVLPVGDAFLAWAKSDRLWNDSPQPANYAAPFPAWWRLPLHGVTLAVLTLLWWGMGRRLPVNGVTTGGGGEEKKV